MPFNYKTFTVPIQCNFNQAIQLTKRPHDAVGGIQLLLHHMPNMFNLNLIIKKTTREIATVEHSTGQITWIVQNGIFMKNYMQEGFCIKEDKTDLASKSYRSCREKQGF